LSTFEERLEQALDAITTSVRQSSATITRAERQTFGQTATEPAVAAQRETCDGAFNTCGFGVIDPSVYASSNPVSLALPPREDLIPIIAHYFLTSNYITPLFDQHSFMRQFNSWYGIPVPRNRVMWAMINVVIALGLRDLGPGPEGSTISATTSLDTHVRNAYSILPELAVHDQDLLGVQALLGITILFQNSSDQTAASFIIASAIRLSHRILLHSRRSSRLRSEVEILQANRVFWIAYTLDKVSGYNVAQRHKWRIESWLKQEISLRVKLPSIQGDSDIDQPLPLWDPSDGAGIIWTGDGTVPMNLFRFRVELAHIQGKVYETLYSNQTSALSAGVRQERIAQLQASIDTWYSNVPPAFRMEQLSSTASPTGLVQMTKLYYGFLMAQAMTHGFYSKNADWLKQMGSLSAGDIDDIEDMQAQFGAAKGDDFQAPPSTAAWDKLVHISRSFMGLFHLATNIECLAW
jgi:hypothetical protein